MVSRSRIRWENLAKLGAGAIACLALAAGLPGLLRRPEPPPLDSDIGLPQASAEAVPAPGAHHEPSGGQAGHVSKRARPKAGRSGPDRPEPGRHHGSDRHKRAPRGASSVSQAPPADPAASPPPAPPQVAPAPQPALSGSPTPSSAPSAPAPSPDSRPAGPSEFGFEH